MTVNPIPRLDIRSRDHFTANAGLERILPKIDLARRNLAEAQADLDWLEDLADSRTDPAPAALAARWRRLTEDMAAAQERHDKLAGRRQAVTRQLYAPPGVTHRSLAALLGVSQPLINQILHRGETKPGRKTTRP